MAVYKIIEVVGISKKSFADAANNAVKEAAKSVRGIRRAEVSKFDIKVENNKVVAYRAEVRISFELD